MGKKVFVGRIPETFLARFRALLEPSEFHAFQHAILNRPRGKAIRVNYRKTTCETVRKFLDVKRPVPWSRTGFFISQTKFGANNILHSVGGFYAQDASAQAVIGVSENEILKLAQRKLQERPYFLVLDACSAPGGKSTQLLEVLQGIEGAIVIAADEDRGSRRKALSDNLERWGCPSVITIQSRIEKLARLPSWRKQFDLIVLDAPCSMEAMLRRSQSVQWSHQRVKSASLQQMRMLAAAESLLSDTGMLLYSTCTFSPEENENVVSAFLEAYPQFDLIDLSKELMQMLACHDPSWKIDGNIAKLSGRPEWSRNRDLRLSKSLRLWPHFLDYLGPTDGHFVCAMSRESTSKDTSFRCPLPDLWQPLSTLGYRSLELIKRTLLTNEEEASFSALENISTPIERNGHIYFLPFSRDKGVPLDFRGVNVPSPGLYICSMDKHGRVIPARSLLFSLDVIQKENKSSFLIKEDSQQLADLVLRPRLHDLGPLFADGAVSAVLHGLRTAWYVEKQEIFSPGLPLM